MFIKEHESAESGWPQLLTTAEVAQYLRLRERKVYELVRQGAIPCTRAGGKLLFPRARIDQWVSRHQEAEGHVRPVLPVLAGSQDPLLEWALRESGSELAELCRGSGDGVQRLLRRDAMVAGLHVLDRSSGRYNDPHDLGLAGIPQLVMVRWAWRAQGLLVARGNPLGIRSLQDLPATGARVAFRQSGAGAHALFQWLLERAAIDPSSLRYAAHPSLSEESLAEDVRAGEADAGVAIEAAARQHDLDFIPLHQEPFDLALRRSSYFEPPMQRLFEFARTERFVRRAAAMGGYDTADLGRITYNA